MKTVLVLCAISSVMRGAVGTPCERLTEMTIPNVTIRSAVTTQAAPGASNPVPPFCRVQAVAHPVPDSEIEFEVWMPAAANWNGKFEGVGNGGYSGALGYSAMTVGLRSGYATASHNTGHPGDGLRFGQGHPEKVVDYAHRAVHVMTENAKLIVRAHLGRFAEKSYFAGCSAGGHQALSEAQRYPDDYDGIVAGAPASNRIAQTFGFLWSWQALHRADGSLVIDNAKLALVTKAVVDSCDAADGLKDGVIDDPRRCAAPDLSQILSAEEAAAVRKVWSGVKSPKTGEQIFTGWPMGSENFGDQGWSRYLMDPAEPMRVELFRYFLFDDPNWDWRTIDWDRDRAYAQKRLAFMNAIDTDLNAFKRRGGKLIMYAGWADPIVPPQDTVTYFDRVTETMGNTQDFLRLFMAPGMGHCGGGAGPNSFDTVSALDQWVTAGTAPGKLIASHRSKGAVDRTRPLCPYPQVARYSGSGSTDDAANFACTIAK